MLDRHPSLEEFDSWHRFGPGGPWPSDPDEQLNALQRDIVSKNAELLLDCDAWRTKVQRFDAALSALGMSRRFGKLNADYRIRFDGHEFSAGEKNFTDYEFPCALSFIGTDFNDGDIDFRSSTFVDGNINFAWARFGRGHLNFHQTQFGTGVLSFTNTDLGVGTVSFANAKLGDGAKLFTGTKLREGYLDFSRADFGRGNVLFNRAKFEDLFIRFLGADFDEGDLVFEESNLKSCILRLGSIHVKGQLECRHLVVEKADFSASTVDGIADWTDAKFGSIPDFRQMKLDRAPEVARMTVPPPRMTGTGPLSTADDQQDVLKLRKLKAMALAANDHEKDGEFFAYEMMAKRGVEHTTFWQLFFNTIYWKVSFYGQSYLRPLGWLAGSFATFAAIYSLMAALPIGGWQSLAFGITYSFKNSLPFLGTLTRSVPSPEGHVSWFALQLQAIKDAQPGPDWFTVLGTGQAMLSLFFFFFVLLGLRNKFRLK